MRIQFAALIFGLLGSSSLASAQPSPQEGWPLGPGIPYNVDVHDLYGDGCPEIFGIQPGLPDIVAWDESGAEISGWEFDPDALPLLSLQEVFCSGDIDGDGESEIIFLNGAAGYWLYAHEPTGEPIDGFPLMVGDGDTIGRVAVVDLTGDGIAEIVVLDYWFLSTGRIWVYDGAGNVLPGWPQEVPNVPAGLAVGDLEFDGIPEIVVSTVYAFDPLVASPIYVFGPDGQVRDGWPVVVEDLPGSLTGIQIADLDGDYQCELIGSGLSFSGGAVYVLNTDGSHFHPTLYVPGGSYLPEGEGMPVIGNLDGDEDLEIVVPGTGLGVWDSETTHGPFFSGESQAFRGVVLADVDGDGISEISALSLVPERRQHLLNASLEPLPGWPKVRDYNPHQRQPSVFEDIDHDGDLELLYNNGFLVEAWDLENPSGLPLRADWGRWCHDSSRTNNYHHGRPPGPRFLRGDVNGNGTFELADAIVALDYLNGAMPDHPCPARIDFDGDDVADLCDVIDHLTFTFLNGPSPTAPFPECRESFGDLLPCVHEACP